MNIHNVMEEFVYTEVNQLFDTAKENNTPWLSCTCSQCRLDTICYVLNRISPRYIKSGRGLAYSQLEDSLDKAQLFADINKIALEGMKQVLASQRPHANEDPELPKPPVYNFPTIVGKILDGLTFEPAKTIDVHLYIDGEKAQSITTSWENPYSITNHTPGSFSFWVIPQKAQKEGQKKVFCFEIRIEEKNYDSINYFFEIGLTSEAQVRTAYTSAHSFLVPDIHLFLSDDELDKMQD